MKTITFKKETSRTIKLQPLLASAKKVDKLSFRTIEGIYIIALQDIDYCAADGNYSKIYYKGDQQITISKTLKRIEEKLSNHLFIRIHQSYLVKINKIRLLNPTFLVMDNGDKLNVSRKGFKSLKNLISEKTIQL